MAGMDDLQDALADLALRLEAAGAAGTILQETAEDWGLHPALLARRFTESHGRTPEAHAVRDTMPVRLAAARAEASRRAIGFAPGMRRLALGDGRVVGITGLLVPTRIGPCILVGRSRHEVAVIPEGMSAMRSLPVRDLFDGPDGFVGAVTAAIGGT